MFGVIDSTFYSMWIGASSSGCGHGIPEQHVAKGNLYRAANRIRERRGGPPGMPVEEEHLWTKTVLEVLEHGTQLLPQKYGLL